MKKILSGIIIITLFVLSPYAIAQYGNPGPPSAPDTPRAEDPRDIEQYDPAFAPNTVLDAPDPALDQDSAVSEPESFDMDPGPGGIAPEQGNVELPPGAVAPESETIIERPGPLVEDDPLVREPRPLVEQPDPLVEQPDPLVRQPPALVEQPDPLVEQPAPVFPQGEVPER